MQKLHGFASLPPVVIVCLLFTMYRTMAGRRLRDAVQKTLIDSGFPKNVIPVIAGLSNTYSDYQTTFEEYQVQR